MVTFTAGARAQAKTPTRTYVIFECRFAQDLFCAVSTSLSIPDFLIGGGAVPGHLRKARLHALRLQHGISPESAQP